MKKKADKRKEAKEKNKARPTSLQRSCLKSRVYTRWRRDGRSDKIVKIMENQFMDFWHLYAPQAQYHNRFLACRRLWETKSKQERALIMNELAQKQTANPLSYNEKNPYFFLIDWQPPQSDWLAPKQVAHLLAQKIPLAVCFNPRTNSFGTVTKADAERHGLDVHHYM